MSRSIPVAEMFVREGGEFVEVSHITHVDIACDIIRDGAIRPTITTDKTCVLRDCQMPVVWLSSLVDPFWELGSCFGVVEFTMPATTVFQGKRIYQLSTNPAEEDFRRFLITKRCYSNFSNYDLAGSDDPWGLRFDLSGRECYCYAGRSVTFLVDDSVSIDRVWGLRTVSHHPTYCVRSSTCPDKGLSSAKAARVLLNSVVLQNVHQSVRFFTKEEGNQRLPNHFLLSAWTQLCDEATTREGASGGSEVSAAELVSRCRAEIAHFFQIPEQSLKS